MQINLDTEKLEKYACNVVRTQIKSRIQKDMDFLMKAESEVRDLRFQVQQLSARVEKLEKMMV